jgi:uracil phosphoribosyltransferase
MKYQFIVLFRFMLVNFSETPSIISQFVAELRDREIQLDQLRFRTNLIRIGELAGYEISKSFNYKAIEVSTQLGIASCQTVKDRIVIASILRAGLPLAEGLLRILDRAGSAFVGAYRKHDDELHFEIAQDYLASPALDGVVLIVADTMLATGSSLIKALDALIGSQKPSRVHIVCAIASRQGLEALKEAYPQANFWIGAIDEVLTTRQYISPGLGDAGDLAYGPKMQS